MTGQKLIANCIGWGASLILFLTVCRQIWTQWRERSAEGVSAWLLAGQVAASIGFVIYSVLVDNTIFIVTNSVLLMTAIVGQCIYLRNKRLDRRNGKEAEGNHG